MSTLYVLCMYVCALICKVEELKTKMEGTFLEQGTALLFL